LPAEHADYPIADGKGGILGRHDPSGASGSNDLSDGDGGQVRVARDPSALRRVTREHEIADDELAVLGGLRYWLFHEVEAVFLE
jgi:hypothetical protein